MTDILNKLGGAVCGYRRQQRQTQAAIAAKARISVNTLRNIERGKGRASSFDQVLRALDLELKLDGSRSRTPLVKLMDVRLDNGCSQRFVAKQLRMSRNTLGRVELGGPVRLDTLEVYARAIDAKHRVRRGRMATTDRSVRSGQDDAETFARRRCAGEGEQRRGVPDRARSL